MSFDVANVKEIYAKDADLKQEDIQAIQEWLDKQVHLPKISELQQILFLPSCNYSKEQAKITIEKFFTIRTVHADIFDSPDENTIRHTCSVSFMKILPKYTPEGYMVTFSRILDSKPENYIQINQLKCCDMILMRHLYKNGCPKGLVSIFDCGGMVLGHLPRMNMMTMKKFMTYIQEALPVRIKGIHHINMVPYADKMIALLKPFMKKELADKLYFHNKHESLYKHVPKDILPAEFGGQAGTIEQLNKETVEDLVKNINLFQWQDSQKVDESKRAGKGQNHAEKFGGIEGSFKKLELD